MAIGNAALEVSKELIVEARERGTPRSDRRYLPGGGGDVDRGPASTRTASARQIDPLTDVGR